MLFVFFFCLFSRKERRRISMDSICPLLFFLFFFFWFVAAPLFYCCETSSLHTPHLRLFFSLVLFLRVLIELFCSLAFFLSLKQPLLLLYGIGHGFNFNFCTDTHTSNLLVSLLLGLPYRAPALALNHIFFFLWFSYTTATFDVHLSCGALEGARRACAHRMSCTLPSALIRKWRLKERTALKWAITRIVRAIKKKRLSFDFWPSVFFFFFLILFYRT